DQTGEAIVKVPTPSLQAGKNEKQKTTKNKDERPRGRRKMFPLATEALSAICFARWRCFRPYDYPPTAFALRQALGRMGPAFLSAAARGWRRRAADIIRNKHGHSSAEAARHPKSATTYFTTGDSA